MKFVLGGAERASRKSPFLRAQRARKNGHFSLSRIDVKTNFIAGLSNAITSILVRTIFLKALVLWARRARKTSIFRKTVQSIDQDLFFLRLCLINQTKKTTNKVANTTLATIPEY